MFIKLMIYTQSIKQTKTWNGWRAILEPSLKTSISRQNGWKIKKKRCKFFHGIKMDRIPDL